MTNFVLQTCKRGIPFAFLLVQALMMVVLEEEDITSPAYLLLAALASAAYLWTAYSNPGFVIYESKELSPPPISISQPIIPLRHINHKEYDRLVSDQLPVQKRGQSNELGLDSFIQGSQQSGQCSPTSLQLIDKIRKTRQNQTEAVILQSQQADLASSKKDYKCPSLSIVKEQSKLEENGQYQDHIKESVVFEYKAAETEREQNKEHPIIPETLRNLSRWCKVCKNFQPLRVRHCLQCHRCVANFDHHCPWMNNCIGEKNKLKLFLFVLVEDIQLWYLTVRLQRVISTDSNQNALILLWLAVIFLAIVITIMLAFQIFLILKNITTWEHIRWDKIEYLKIFDQTKLRSLFDRGAKENICMAFRVARTKEVINWINFISPQAHNHQIKQEGQTDRKLVQ